MAIERQSGGDLRAGVPVVFTDRKGRLYYDQLKDGSTSNCGGKLIDHDDLIGQPDGLRVKSRQGPYFRVLSATMHQHMVLMSRHAQIITPKDAAILTAWADLMPGSRVVEGGLGSGALAMAILARIGPTGHLTTYELRQEPANLALKNIEAILGAPTNHALRIADIYEGITERDVDHVILDVPEPWRGLEAAASALRHGGHFAAYVPTAIQMQELVLELERSSAFAYSESVETILRNWHVTSRSLRPEHKMIGHTGFLVFARRIASD